ncbi:homocysteine S-methyltransferase family protein [Vibrio sp. 10N]|uniref:homocysteine S-methyltransferase family protein n=1 Tax=Vibrio sp. 10N TaxID=3058938 RepID=UPI0028148DD3|nr:homocysteine S-methyltransferase family protein [Vibrio sp. 10N]
MKAVTILDGGMGRELERIGAPFSQPLWSAQALIESPHFVKQAHQAFIEAGAELITVNSYACVPFHLGDELYAQQGVTLAAKAAKLAHEAATEAKHHVRVAGSLPPVFGSYRPDLFQAERAQAISRELLCAQDDYVDLWLAETVASIAEARMYAALFNTTDKPAYICFTLQDEPDQPAKLRSGEPLEEAVTLLLNAGATGLFFNCSIPEVIAQAIEVVNRITASEGRVLEIGVFANSFTPIKSGHQANEAMQTVRHFSPGEYLAFAKRWYELGASIIGGCCGIEPRHIELLARWKRDLIEMDALS